MHWLGRVDVALAPFAPAYISKKPTFFSPIVALVALIFSIYLIGVAIGSFFTLFTSLLVLYFILTKIFGIQLEAGDVFVV